MILASSVGPQQRLSDPALTGLSHVIQACGAGTDIMRRSWSVRASSLESTEAQRTGPLLELRFSYLWPPVALSHCQAIDAR